MKNFHIKIRDILSCLQKFQIEEIFLIKSLSNSLQSFSHNKVIIFYENVEPLAVVTSSAYGEALKSFKALKMKFKENERWLIFT